MAKGNERIEMAWELDAEPEKVWRMLTEPKLLERWIMANDMEPEVGRKFQFHREPIGGWDGVVHCEVLELDAPKRLAYAWNVGGGMGLETVVTWTLTKTATGTKLELVHSGFEPGPAFGGAKYGWNTMGAVLVKALAEAD